MEGYRIKARMQAFTSGGMLDRKENVKESVIPSKEREQVLGCIGAVRRWPQDPDPRFARDDIV